MDVPEMAWDIMDLSEKPVTLIYDNPNGLPKEILAEDGSIGIRLVDDLFLKKIITKLNKPLVSTSANFSGEKQNTIKGVKCYGKQALSRNSISDEGRNRP